MIICVGNWKMNGSLELLKRISDGLNKEELKEVQVVVAPPFTLLAQARAHLSSRYKIAAQNICPFSGSGSYTGEVGVEQIKETGADLVIIGHSERIVHFGDTNEVFLAQLVLLLKNNVRVIFCMGERKEEREIKKEIIKSRIEEIKSKMEENSLVEKGSRITIAYEPIWSIGTGEVPSVKEIEEVLEYIKEECKEIGISTVLYGGSVKEDNVKELLSIGVLDGFLIGKASLADEFIRICKLCSK